MAVAKEAVWLAWQACGGPIGYGFMQDKGPDQDREKVWDHAYNERDYSGTHQAGDDRINCDYVMGRMMKLRFGLKGAIITHNDYPVDINYQSWFRKYPTFNALFEAAEKVVIPQEVTPAK